MKGIRAGLCLLFVFGVLSFGGVEVWAVSLIEIGAAILLAAWAVLFYSNSELKIQGNPLYAPILGFLVIGLGQLAFHTTAYPFLTRTELLKLAAYFIIFFLTAQSFRSRSDMEGLGWMLVIFCFAVSLQGIMQHFTSEGKIYWFRELAAGGDLFGPYVNRNDFAGFVELTLPVGLSLMVFRGARRDLFPLVTVLTVVPISAMLLAGSRGGIICLVFEVAILALLARAWRGTERPRVAPIAMVVLAALGLIAWVGVGKAIERFSSLPSKDVSISRRFSMFRGALHMFRNHPVAGTGLGTLVAAYPPYETYYDGLVVDHVHNDYAEALAENRSLGSNLRAELPVAAISRASEEFRGRPEPLFTCSARRGNRGLVRAPVTQLRRLQPTYPRKRSPLSTTGLHSDFGPLCVQNSAIPPVEITPLTLVFSWPFLMLLCQFAIYS